VVVPAIQVTEAEGLLEPRSSDQPALHSKTLPQQQQQQQNKKHGNKREKKDILL
jgi:hypothetical protein